MGCLCPNHRPDPHAWPLQNETDTDTDRSPFYAHLKESKTRFGTTKKEASFNFTVFQNQRKYFSEIRVASDLQRKKEAKPAHTINRGIKLDQSDERKEATKMMFELVELLVAYRRMKASERRIDEIIVKELTRIIRELKKMEKDQGLSEIISNIQELRAIFPESIVNEYTDQEE